MSVIGVVSSGKKSPCVLRFENEPEARKNGNGYKVFSSAQQIAECGVLTDEDLQMIAGLGEDSSRLLCAETIWAKSELVNAKEDDMTNEAIRNEVNEHADSKVAQKKPRSPAQDLAGKSLFPSETVRSSGNPRREGTHGHKAMQIILSNPGVTYEKFLELGGRRIDLIWDLDHGHVALAA